MSEWIPLKVAFKLAQPLAIGPGWRLGFVTLTRLDVPPRTLWGAFTDAIGRWFKAEGKPLPEFTTGAESGENGLFGISKEHDFVKIGSGIDQNLRFLPGIFIAKKGEQEEIERLAPWYEFGKGMMLRVRDQKNNWYTYRPEMKRKDYIFGHGSTALNYEQGAAEEGMLHETERISNQVNLQGKVLQVWMEAVLFVQKNFAEGLKGWLTTYSPKYLRVGRDISSGDGCFDQINVSQINDTEITEGRPESESQGVWDLKKEEGPIWTCKPAVSKGDEKYILIRLHGPFLQRSSNNILKGYWGEFHPYLVREFDVKGRQGFGRRMGYPDGEEPIWILESGGVLAFDKDQKSIKFILRRDGWELLVEKS